MVGWKGGRSWTDEAWRLTKVGHARPPWQLEALPRAREGRPASLVPQAGGEPPLPPARGRALGWRGATNSEVETELLRLVKRASFERVWNDIPPYTVGYSPDHIAAILSLPKCPFDSGDNLDDVTDFDSYNSCESKFGEQLIKETGKHEITRQRAGGGEAVCVPESSTGGCRSRSHPASQGPRAQGFVRISLITKDHEISLGYGFSSKSVGW
ncbi:hypothetical protein Salat_0197800 [Sesamum alatum]|uniref:Uncharacterized protein n=1 Tax=Sesamum alatum TaxID=300844 RepID=A0AAE2CXZ0_9LAMI|nr:hypothetical protein Salat_0197800 [Sesamum alatum]